MANIPFSHVLPRPVRAWSSGRFGRIAFGADECGAETAQFMRNYSNILARAQNGAFTNPSLARPY